MVREPGGRARAGLIRWAQIFWYVLSLRCEEAERVRALEREGAATGYQRAAERAHRWLCRSCRHARDHVERLEEALADLRERAEDPPAFGGGAMPAGARARLRGVVGGASKKS